MSTVFFHIQCLSDAGKNRGAAHLRVQHTILKDCDGVLRILCGPEPGKPVIQQLLALLIELSCLCGAGFATRTAFAGVGLRPDSL